MEVNTMGLYPQKPVGNIQSNVSAVNLDRGFIAHEAWTATQAAAASATAVHAADTDTGAEQTISTDITPPPCARNITATSGGTAADIKAVQIIVTGTDINNQVITETLPIFTVNTATTVLGSKAFKTVTSYVRPAGDSPYGDTVSIGFGDKLGLHYARATLPCIAAFLATVLEATAATIAASLTVLSSNTIDLQSALNGTAVDAYIVV
jgi:hypothetical protein